MLVEGLERLGHIPWVDRQLTGGQDWWDAILAQIRECDAMVIAVSPTIIESSAATSERDYARALGKPLLPVIIKPVTVGLLPLDLARVQYVDYSEPGPMAAFELAGAVGALPAAPALPDPLPTPPSVPISYLSDLSARVHAPTLSFDEQLGLVGRLRPALARPAERDGARQLLLALQRRDDLFHTPAREVEALLDATPPDDRDGDRDGGPTLADNVAGAPPGWYEDPSRRHQLRWFDGDWTEWASDGGAVVEDPIS